MTKTSTMTDTSNNACNPKDRIRALNDRYRRNPIASGVPGKLVVTCGVRALPPERQAAIISRVQSFDTFTEENDPNGEHDFGAFDSGDQKIFWKIDYYDRELAYASEDPAVPEKTVRVLTILLADEY